MKIEESKKINKYLTLARELKKIMEHEDDGDNNCSWCKGLEKDWKNWKSEEEMRQSGPQHCSDRLEYSEESWTPEETFSHWNSSERRWYETLTRSKVIQILEDSHAENRTENEIFHYWN